MKEGNRVLETSEITHPRTQCHFPKYLNRQQHRCANLTYRKTNRVDTVTTYRAAAHSQCQSTARRRVTKICECRDVNGQSPMCSAWWHCAPWQLACGRVTARQVVTGRHNNPLSSFEQETFWAEPAGCYIQLLYLSLTLLPVSKVVCLCELPLRIPAQFMPLGLHKHLHIQALFYLTAVTSHFPSARSLTLWTSTRNERVC